MASVDVPAGTTELGIDIIKVDRIRASLARFGDRFTRRVLTPSEQRYVRGRPETMAGRWAAKEAVSKVLGLGVRGIGWRDIEIERLPTGQPAVRLHGRAATRADQLGVARVAVSISHEADYAVAIAFGIRTTGGRYVFPADIEDRLNDRERRILARMERLRTLHEASVTGGAGARDAAGTTRRPVTERSLGFGRRADAAPVPVAPATAARTTLDDEAAAMLVPERPKRGHKGDFGKLLVIAGSIDYAGAALLVCRAAGRAGAGLVTLAVPESLQPLFAAKVVEATTMALPEDDLEEVEPEDALARILDHEHDAIVLGPGLRPGLATTELVRALLAAPEESANRASGDVRAEEAAPRPSEGASVVLDAEALRSLASIDGWWDGVHRSAILTPHAGEFGRLRAAGGVGAEDGDLIADDEARAAAASDAAETWRQVVVLKGARTVVASPDGNVTVAPFENPALASGGTGDVLAGVIGALLAQGLSTYDAARLGVYLHGLAADVVSERVGDAGLLASDLPELIPVVRRRLAAIAERRRKGANVGFRARDGGTQTGGAGG